MANLNHCMHPSHPRVLTPTLYLIRTGLGEDFRENRKIFVCIRALPGRRHVRRVRSAARPDASGDSSGGYANVTGHVPAMQRDRLCSMAVFIKK
ncbi:hypothetical protein EVAR_48433_1 [Eumeta japonica]|uniref:Uncharacterized protein n=1 Tax=Eumeta variegata TaxID=151549 RepID=A0A4C1XRE1_EUMVA|nr:hypothetical protein EVAR_48433_1 [Eumeta japonica]